MRFVLAALLLLSALGAAPEARADATVDSSKFFADSSMRLRADEAAQKFLVSAGEWLKQDRSRRLRLQVHADDRLLRADNQVLALGRARALARELTRRGASKKQILLEAVGHEAVQRLPETRRIVFDFSEENGSPSLAAPKK